MRKADLNKKKTQKMLSAKLLYLLGLIKPSKERTELLTSLYSTKRSKENATDLTSSSTKKFLVTLLKKLIRDLLSLKLWILGIATGLLVVGLIEGINWVTVVCSLLGMREFSEYRENVYGPKDSA